MYQNIIHNSMVDAMEPLSGDRGGVFRQKVSGFYNGREGI